MPLSLDLKGLTRFLWAFIRQRGKSNLHLKLNMNQQISISDTTIHSLDAQTWYGVRSLQARSLRWWAWTWWRYGISTAVLWTNQGYEKRGPLYVGDEIETMIEPERYGDDKRLILVTHDESRFQFYRRTEAIWMEKDRNVLRPKGDGRSIMV